MDDTIDESDIEYVQSIIDGTNEATELADANYDGEINEDDIAQIELIISGEDEELTIIDADGRVVTVKKPVEHVILLSTYPAEAMRILGVQDKVVGVSDTVHQDDVCFPEFSKLPEVGSSSSPDYEEILSLNSDLVIAFSKGDEHADKLLGIPVVRLPLWVPNDFIEELVKTSYIFGKKDEANRYIDEFYDIYLDYIKEQTQSLSEEERPKVYVAATRDIYRGYCAKSGAQQMIDLCGGRNILSDYDISSSEIDPEVIMVKNPDIIIKYLTSGSGAGYMFDDPSEIENLWYDIISRPELANVNAVKNKQVYIIDNGLNYGLDYPIAMIYWAKWFQPELFEDLDPTAIHQEYVTKFQGLDFDVRGHGIFVYHPELYPDGR